MKYITKGRMSELRDDAYTSKSGKVSKIWVPLHQSKEWNNLTGKYND